MLKIPEEEIIAALQRYSQILGGWIFGSQISGRQMKNSDLDIGLLFRESPESDLILTLISELEKAANGRFEIDLTSLNEAGVVLRFEAISGKRIFCRDSERCAEFASLTAREYEDEMGFAEKTLSYWK